ncbi:MAG: hypothetical protein R2787_05985 [Saprospiraceae bacterium]|nr:hypothetical protein [Saprospiraceae bacterium]MCB9312402.1 hypothetical protein [Lewinellaceae bacterium]
MKTIALSAILTILLLGACKNDPVITEGPDPCATPLSYAVDIFPLIDETCNYAGCHAGAYDTYEGIEPKLQSGLLVDRVFQRMSDPALRMPPSKSVYPNVQRETLTQEELDLIQCWVNQGYPR